MIQETKLRIGDPTPRIFGYATLRDDRKALFGGGLLTFIKETLIYERICYKTRNATECMTFRVKLSRNRWIKLTNVYAPPCFSHGQEAKLVATEIIPTTEDSLIAGDFNCHAPLWDPNIPTDQRGDAIENWLAAEDLTILNSGSPTRVSRVDGQRDSAPDITICGRDFSKKCTWDLMDGIGSSDHIPICIRVALKVSHQTVRGSEAKWRIKNVDWSTFSSAVENSMDNICAETSIKKRIALFNGALISSATTHVGKVKRPKRPKPWMNPAVRTAVRKRNKIWKERGPDKEWRAEWLTACKEASEATKLAKAESWRNLLDDAITEKSSNELWKIVETLDGCPDTNSPNEALSHKGRLITSNKKKADVFMQHYASVSKLKLDKNDRATNRDLKKRLSKAPPTAEAPKFNLQELRRAIGKMKAKGAAGPDDIPPSFLKALGPKALTTLLDIFNSSFHLANCPQVWKNAIIIPLLKSGKPAGELKSYRPISLTSCVVKLLERMVADRLMFLAESNKWLNSAQAGFRRGRSCEDQILRMVQAISDGLQQKKMQRSVLVLLDFSQAFDTVWRQKLLLSMLDLGVPIEYIRWIYQFLNNRQARVKFNGSKSISRQLHQGLPQGSVLSPLLFIFYINNLANILPANTVNCLFADDVSILSSDTDRSKAEAAVQAAVDIVTDWCKAWKLNLNASKSEVSFFSSWTREANHEPVIIINNAPIKYNPNPVLLGVTLDWNLSFTPHATNVAERVSNKTKLLGALSHSEWGWRKDTLKSVYLTSIRSIMDYAGPGWQPWMKKDTVGILERAQNKALSRISGQFITSPIGSLNRETDIPTYATIIRRQCLKAQEKGLRMPPDHPKSIAFNANVAQRTSRQSCRDLARKLTPKLEKTIDNRKPITLFPDTPPWKDTCELTIHDNVPGVASRHDDPASKRKATIERINSLTGDYNIYTDGSAKSGRLEGGAAAVVTIGDAEDPIVVSRIMQRGRRLTCSYEEEACALELAITWINEHCSAQSKILICTDSKSLCQKLAGSCALIADLRLKLLKAPGSITLQWVPGHSDVPGNELADVAAKEATTLQTDGCPISYNAICAHIDAMIVDPPFAHPRPDQAYAGKTRKQEQRLSTRADQVFLAQIRSGKHKSFKKVMHALDGHTAPNCPRCNAPEHTLEHWFLECEASVSSAYQSYGFLPTHLGVLSERTTESVAHARASLLAPKKL